MNHTAHSCRKQKTRAGPGGGRKSNDDACLLCFFVRDEDTESNDRDVCGSCNTVEFERSSSIDS